MGVQQKEGVPSCAKLIGAGLNPLFFLIEREGFQLNSHTSPPPLSTIKNWTHCLHYMLLLKIVSNDIKYVYGGWEVIPLVSKKMTHLEIYE